MYQQTFLLISKTSTQYDAQKVKWTCCRMGKERTYIN